MKIRFYEFALFQAVCIFAICGGLRCDELTRITVRDVTKHGDLYVVDISKENKKKEAKSFTICSAALCEIVERYASLRPHSPKENRFFLNYRSGSGSCTTQVIGVHKFAKMPRRIAEYCELPDAHTYTGKIKLNFHFVVNS